MAKVTITIEDKDDGSGRVRVTCNPSYKQMAQAIVGHREQSNAFGMAVAIGNFLIDRDKKVSMGHPKSKLIIPQLRPGRA